MLPNAYLQKNSMFLLSCIKSEILSIKLTCTAQHLCSRITAFWVNSLTLYHLAGISVLSECPDYMGPEWNMWRCFLFTLEICALLINYKCIDWYIISSLFKATKRICFGRIGSIIVVCCLIFLLCTQSPQITNYSFYHRLIACISMQTAKFHEPVTLDFLDAELENEIKVEVWKIDYSALIIPKAHNRINSVDSIILFLYLKLFCLFFDYFFNR